MTSGRSEAVTPTGCDPWALGAEQTRRRESLRSRHRLVLMVVAVALVGSFALEVVPNGRVALRGFESYALPHTCLSRMVFERGCPACGLTRSFIHLANGRWQESLAVHRLGWLLALVALLQIPYRAAGLLQSDPLPLGSRIPSVTGYCLLVLLVANWAYGLLLL